MSTKTPHQLDLAIVGGGVAGAYVAYRLGHHRPDWAIGLFEATDRIGGRLLSLRFPGLKSRAAELGGMRFRTSQPLISGLTEELGLRTRPFLTVHDDNQFFLRGSRWRHGDPGDAQQAYQLDVAEASLSPGELLVSAFERIVPGATELADDEWVTLKREHQFLGRPLRHWSLKEALKQVLSPEGYQYVVDGFGYATILDDRNAADAIPWVLIEARPELENTTLVDGMEILPRDIASRFVASGGKVLLRHKLVGLEWMAQDASGFRLHFENRGAVAARRLVLALPRSALEAVLKQVQLWTESRIDSLVGSVTGHPAAKLSLGYTRPWWRELGLRGLRTVSDLALSKTYYFDEREGAFSQGFALLLASYSDGPSREAWSSLTDRSGFPKDPGEFDSSHRWERYAASAEQIAEAQRQLRELHQATEIPDPIVSAFVDWGAEPFGACWHVWNPGVKSWDVMEQIVEPIPNSNLFICGEAYSWSQGWVEGALESAQQVIDRLASRAAD